jgi:hypothetical protein
MTLLHGFNRNALGYACNAAPTFRECIALRSRSARRVVRRGTIQELASEVAAAADGDGACLAAPAGLRLPSQR